MACKFSLDFNESAESALDKARGAIESQNGVLNGDVHAGDFEVNVFGNNIKGNYTINEQTIHLEITDKPFFVPCSMIESFLAKQIG